MALGRFEKGLSRDEDPRDVFFRNETAIIGGLYKWGVSPEALLSSMLHLRRIGTLPRLIRQSKVLRIKTGLPSPRQIYSLTETGVVIAEMRLDESHNYPETGKESLITTHFLHEITVQALTIAALNSGVVRDFSTPRMMEQAGMEDVKIPDAYWIGLNDEVIALEVEFDQKWDRKLDNFLGRTIESIESGQVAECLIVTTSRATARNYAKSLERNKIPIWVKKFGGTWRVEREVDVRRIVTNRIQIVLISEPELNKILSAKPGESAFREWIDQRRVLDTSGLE